jgi:UDP-glucose 4-epimerase
MRIAVTGANGFIGRAVVPALLARGHQVVALTRSPDAAQIVPGVTGIATGAIEAITDWRRFLDGTDAVVHLAARAHVPDAAFADEAQVRAVNTTATLRLAEDAARRGIKHFLYLSSVKVNGQSTTRGRPFRVSDTPNPDDLYARSKRDAELGLTEIAARTGLQPTVLRPPLVYGPGVRANFRRLIEFVAGVPLLPFGAIDNRRSLISVDNLASAIATGLEHEAAQGRTFLISDGTDLSTPELVRLIAKTLGKRVVLMPVPVPLLAAAGRLAGRGGSLRRLTDSLEVDPSDFVRSCGWQPVEQPAAGIAKTVAWWRAATAYENA